MANEDSSSDGRTARAAPPRVSLRVALLAALAVWLLQAAVVHRVYHGRWNALFYHGADFPLPPQLSGEHVYTFPGMGYDGQLYHLIAHDPLFRKGLSGYVDDPRLRYRRILVPALAATLAGGQDRFVDAAYYTVTLFFVGLGTFWLSRAAVERARSPWWGLGFLSIPAVWVSMDRLTVDVALAALCVGFVRYASLAPGPRLTAVLLLAGLTRETGLLLILACSLFYAARREWKTLVLVSSTAIPALVWFVFVASHTESRPYHGSFVPLSGIARAWNKPTEAQPPADAEEAGSPRAAWREARPSIIRLLDRAALAGILLAFVMALTSMRWRRPGADEIAGVLFVLLGLAVQRPENWQHVYDFGRVHSPLLIFLALRGLALRSLLPLMPLALMAPRLALQMSGPWGGVARSLLG